MKTRSLVASLAACLAIAGCGDDFNGDKYSLTVFAYNAVTGEPIASADLASGLAIYQGASKMTPAALDSGVAGAVIFQGLEADYASGNKVFPIRAHLNGYQDFQGEVSFAVNEGDGVRRDEVYAQVGYIHLWPNGFHAPDYNFKVLYGGEPVANATVQLSPQVCFWDDGDWICVGPGSWASGNYQKTAIIRETYDGAVAAVYGTTDADGKLTFPGANLGLGLGYQVSVLPLTANGVTLGMNEPGTLVVGYSSVDNVINLTAISNDPATSSTHGLYVKSIAPAADQLQADGKLTITFNIPVAKTSTFANDFSATCTGFVGGVPGTPTATPTLSADGLTLTLAPNWTAPGPTGLDPGANCQYSVAATQLVVPAYPAEGITLTALRLGAVGGRVLTAADLKVAASAP